MYRRFFTFLLALLTVLLATFPAFAGDETNKPKNIILMIADGCGHGMLEMTGHWKNGAPGTLLFESFPVRLYVTTHSLDTGACDPQTVRSNPEALFANPTDSAAAVTATATSVKAKNGVLSLDPGGQPVMSVLEYAESLGKASGIVTTSYFNDATPSGFATHNVDRANRGEIARALIMESAVDFLSGSGHPWYDNDGARRTEANWRYFGAEALFAALTGGTAGADADGDGTPDPWTFIDTREGMQQIAAGADTPKRVFALLRATNAAQALRTGIDADADDDQPYETPRRADIATLAEQARAALAVIGRDPDGFFLMVENEGTDEAGHMQRSGRTVEEVLEHEDAVRAVCEWVEANSSWEETLLIVTADHDTGLPNGPAAADSILTAMVGRGKGVLPEHRWLTEDHANLPVPLFARGCGAELLREYADQSEPVFGPVMDNTEIAAAIFKLLGK